MPEKPTAVPRVTEVELGSALAWAVGKLEGAEIGSGMAGEVLERWRQQPPEPPEKPKEDGEKEAEQEAEEEK